MQMLSDLHCKEGKTIIMVTHDTDIAQYAERSVRIRDGVIESTEENRRKVCDVPREGAGLKANTLMHGQAVHDKSKDKKHEKHERSK
jgi:energy-coupling factor transporter ATP-binding protein EcfA2